MVRGRMPTTDNVSKEITVKEKLRYMSGGTPCWTPGSSWTNGRVHRSGFRIFAQQTLANNTEIITSVGNAEI